MAGCSCYIHDDKQDSMVVVEDLCGSVNSKAGDSGKQTEE